MTTLRYRPGTIEAKVAEYKGIQREVSLLNARLSGIKSDLMSTIAANGFEDDKGSQWLELHTAVEVGDDTFTYLKREKRTQVFLNEDRAEEILKDAGVYEQALTPVLDVDKIYVLQQEGLIADEALDRMFDTKVTWAFVPVKE